jgi:hypothetical protein
VPNKGHCTNINTNVSSWMPKIRKRHIFSFPLPCCCRRILLCCVVLCYHTPSAIAIAIAIPMAGRHNSTGDEKAKQNNRGRVCMGWGLGIGRHTGAGRPPDAQHGPAQRRTRNDINGRLTAMGTEPGWPVTQEGGGRHEPTLGWAVFQR